MPHIENIFMSASNADAIDKVRNRHQVVEPLHAQKQRSPVSYDIELLKVAATYSPTTQCSTIGDAELNDPVRNGKGWDLSAITTLIISSFGHLRIFTFTHFRICAFSKAKYGVDRSTNVEARSRATSNQARSTSVLGP